MRKSRYVGLSLVLLAGCAGPAANKSSVSRVHSVKVQVPPAATQPIEESPKWEAAAGPSASDLLATKAADYAKTMQTADNSPPVAAVGADPASVRFAQTPVRQTPSDIVRTLTAPPVAPAVAPAVVPADATSSGAGAAVLASARSSPAGDGPQILPESADFQSISSMSGNKADPLGERLRKRLNQNPQDIADQLDVQLYALLSDDPTAELAAVSALPSDDRELVSALVDGLNNFRSTVRENGNLLAAQKIKPLLEMADRLRSQADLTVSTIALCRRVDGFGKYDPISPATFPAGRENAAIVYCEVENFLTKRTSAQMWETNFSEQVAVYTDSGMLAWSDTARKVTDECRNRRHDFFAYNVIRLPANLTVGRYLLKVSIKDENANHVAEATVPVSINAE